MNFREVNNKDMLKRWYDCMEEVYIQANQNKVKMRIRFYNLIILEKIF